MRIQVIKGEVMWKDLYRGGDTEWETFVDTRNYDVNQISKYTWRDIEKWALENGVTLKAWEELGEIFNNVDIGY